MRRKDVAVAKPNEAHRGIAALEGDFNVHIITQNIDDLHERAGSTNVLHLHGEIFKMRSVNDPIKSYPITGDINLGDLSLDGAQLRPHIVWFDELVPMIEPAVEIMRTAEIFVVIGTSLVVYPAAGLVNYAPWQIPKFIVDKQIPYAKSLHNVTPIETTATNGIKVLSKLLQSLR